MRSVKFTVLGSSGFIGSNLVWFLKNAGYRVLAPPREKIFKYRDLGHVFYCIGVTADFRSRPFETVEAHVCLLQKIIRNSEFESFTYLSSARVYEKSSSSREEQPLPANPLDNEDLYNISKMLGESVCFASGRNGMRVVRLSNVYGCDFQSQNFLTAIIRDAFKKKHVVLRSSLDSEKDYISIDDVVENLPNIALGGKHKIYNLASGVNVTHRKIVTVLERELNCNFSVKNKSPLIIFPDINISRVCTEFGFKPKSLIIDLPTLVRRYKENSVNK